MDGRPPAGPDDPLPLEFVMGTNRCDVWEVEYKHGVQSGPEVSVQVYGHLADLYAVATHPTDPDVFASAAEADRVFLWNAADCNLIRTSPTGVVGRSIAFSAEPVPSSAKYFPGWSPTSMKNQPVSAGHHIAVGGKSGSIAVIDGVTLQPLAMLKDVQSAVDDVKFCGGPRQMLAAGSHDLVVDVYDVDRGYVHLSRCQGHQATITHLDWSLPLYSPNGAGGADKPQRLLQTNCASYEILHWDPVTGRQVLVNQRDTQWESFTCVLGFSVMGVWPDGSDGTDINAVDRAKCGQSVVRDPKVPRASLGRWPAPDSCAELDGAGFLVTADDFGKVKLFNYPCVFNDAPYREYKGHASHAMCIRFTADDARVLTAGGHDRAMLQFKTVGVRAGDEPPVKPCAPVPKRTWGPIDGGKAYGWIEDKGTVNGTRTRGEGVGRPPPVAMPSMKYVPGSSPLHGEERRATWEDTSVGPTRQVSGAGAVAGPSVTLTPPAMGRSQSTARPATAATGSSGTIGPGYSQKHSRGEASFERGRYADVDDEAEEIIEDEF
uniref:EML-like second beta-propeller domain-containing protein n=1 Tax=Mantoniella antarctica TaxID=81844 RepID=A0A7S0T1C8_9CHLO